MDFQPSVNITDLLVELDERLDSKKATSLETKADTLIREMYIEINKLRTLLNYETL